MFSTLRQGSVVYILNKENTPELQIGTVSGVNSPLTYTPYPQAAIDIQVKVGETSCEFKQLPGASSIVNYNNGKTVISDNKELMCSEVETMQKTSQDIIDHIPYHKEVISACEDMIKQLNPQVAKQKEQESKINSLETKVVGIESKLDDITSMLTKALSK